MADSNITKQALSNALKELLEEQPFEKISISDICDRCRMNRKSFYYHFREFLQPILRLRVTELLEQDDVPQMVYDFVVDGIICAIERWLLDKNCAPVEEFMYNLKRLVQVLFVGIQKRIVGDPKWLE